MRKDSAAIFLLFVALAMPFFWTPLGAQVPAKQDAPAKIDVNSASGEDLEKLPGVGPVIAKKIIAGRPYKTIDGLTEAGLSEAEITKLKPLAEAKRPAKDDTPPAGKLDVNSASIEELEKLPGIGPVLAKKIVEGRPYRTIDDLKNVGVSETEIAKIKPMAEAKRAGTSLQPVEKESPKKDDGKPAVEIDLNNATETELKALPGIDDVYSKKIVAGRPYKSVADLSRVGISAATIEKITPLVAVEAPVRTPPKPGLVWANSESKIYHKEGDRWYGKTFAGEWMTEAEAIKAGYRATK